LLTRALLVVGGTVLATVVGWLISTSSASAATSTPTTLLPTVPGVPPVSSVLGTTTHAVTTALPPTTGVREVTGALGTAVHRLRDHVPGRVVVAPLNVLPVPPVATPTPVRAGSTSTQAGDRTPDRAASVAVPDVPPPAHVGAVSVRSQVDRSPAAAPHHATPAPARQVPGPAPWHPAPVPAPAPGGGAGVVCLGGFGFLPESGTWPAPGFDVVLAVEVSTPLGRPSAGRQPGITPD
jgi:hypothetical protein